MLGLRRSISVGQEDGGLLREADLSDDESGIRGVLHVGVHFEQRTLGRGKGLESLNELMELAIRELPRSEERLGTLLIEIYESQNLPVGYSR
jgi:hypothetical protein